MFSSLNEKELERALLYLEDQDAGFAIAEVNEAALERRAVDHFLDRLPEGECGVIDLKQLPPQTRPAAFIRDSVADAPETRAFFILNLPVAAGEGSEAREQMVRELNFSRDVLARLDRLLFFFFPTWFVDLVIRQAKDFFDFVPVVFPLKAEAPEGREAVQAPETPLLDKTYLENRIAFLKETLASGDLGKEEAAKTHEDLGDCYEQLSEYEAALAHFRKAKTKTKNPKKEANLDVIIGRIYAIWGRLDEAMALFQRSLAVYKNLEDSRSRAVTMGYIARILANKGEVDEALKFHTERLEVFEALGDRRERAVTLWNIGQIQKMRGETQSARQNIGESCQISHQLGDANGLSVVGKTYGQLLLENGDTETGMEVLERSRDMYRKLGQPDNARVVEEIIAQFSK